MWGTIKMFTQIYEAFGRGDVPAILALVGQNRGAKHHGSWSEVDSPDGWAGVRDTAGLPFLQGQVVQFGPHDFC